PTATSRAAADNATIFHMANPQQMRELSTNNNAKSCLRGLEWAQEGKRAGRNWLTRQKRAVRLSGRSRCLDQAHHGGSDPVWIGNTERAPRGRWRDQGMHDERHTQL